jgi:GntR family transcriptional regulator/MocR family aminotransferase
LTKSTSLLISPSVLVDRSSDVPLSVQLYSGIRDAILNRELRAGMRVPPTRFLAQQLKLSRNTVTSAYDQLISEGYLEGRIGSGTVVATTLPEYLLVAPKTEQASRTKSPKSLSQRGIRLSSGTDFLRPQLSAPRAFMAGEPDLAAFPFHVWSKLLSKRWNNPKYNMLSDADPSGYKPLREAIAAYIRVARSVRCEADQIFVVNGSQQALDITVRLLTDPGDTVVMEDPGYARARTAFEAAGASVYPLDVDQCGACVPRNTPARLAFLTPSHQFPLGVTMCLQRRLDFLRWAESNDAWILEDDYDGEYRYRGHPEPALQGMDGAERVFYIGSFSKTLFPALRLGYIVVPESLVDSFWRARLIIDGHFPILEQAVVADFILEGYFGQHIRRMRLLYEERQEALLEGAKGELKGLLKIPPCDSGMHLLGWLPEGLCDLQVAESAKAQGVYVRPLSWYRMRDSEHSGLILGFAATNPEQIGRGIKRLSKAIEGCLKPN